MKLCYTTSLNSGQGPDKPGESLGGYISNMTVKNDEFDNLFGEISIYGASKSRTEYRALVLVNDSMNDASDVSLYMSSTGESNQGEILIAPVAMGTDKEGRPVMERVGDIYSKPFVGDFQVTTEDDKLDIGTIPAGGSIGVWVCRKINKDMIDKDYRDVARPIPNKIYWFEPVPKEKEETWELNVEWN